MQPPKKCRTLFWHFQHKVSDTFLSERISDYLFMIIRYLEVALIYFDLSRGDQYNSRRKGGTYEKVNTDLCAGYCCNLGYERNLHAEISHLS
jgi:hypothetical protein